MSRRRARRPSGFTLIELMISVFILSLLLSVSIAAFTRYVLRARSTEASLNLGNMARSAKVYWLVDHTAADGSILPRQFPASTMHPGFCCEFLAGRCPSNVNAHELFSDNNTWRDLNFSVEDPHAFTYTWVARASSARAYAESYLTNCFVMSSYRSFMMVLNGDENSVSAGTLVEEYSGGGN